MDKILRRVRMVEKQALRRRTRQRKATSKGVSKQEQQPQVKEATAEVGLSIRNAKIARHEDWDLGPLAPRRDVPRILDHNPAGNLHWGTISIGRAMSTTKLRPLDLEDRCRWAGGAEHLCLAEGDRVVITEGTHKGKIDKIMAIQKEYGVVRLQDTKVSSARTFDLTGCIC